MAKKKRWPWIVGGIVGFLVLVSMFSHPSTPTATSTSSGVTSAQQAAPVKPAGPATQISDGTFQVGVDMAAGRYKTPGPAADAIVKNCYWQRSRTDSGQFTDIIANGNDQGPGSVTVNKGEFFQTSGGCTWTKQ